MKLLHTELDLENIHIKQDMQTGLIAIIAIHNTKNGPSLGGCRFVPYQSVDDAMLDAMKLAKAMTYKSAMAELPLGGGKAVIIHHEQIKDRAKLFASFGEFVESLKGRYITATDSGSTEDDMKIVAQQTQHVTSINLSREVKNDTAAMTAEGVLQAMHAIVKYQFKRDNLKDIHVAIQGIGSVGFLLAKLLLAAGARLSISDTNQHLLTERAKSLGDRVNIVSPQAIMTIDCDIFSPCALGGILNKSSIESLQTSIVCGAANNQLQEVYDGEILRQKNILYVPDYVANAGGVICAAAQARVISKEESYAKVERIYAKVMEVLKISAQEQLATNLVANRLAEMRFN